MRKHLMSSLCVLVLGPAAFALTFTGDAALDFALTGVVVELDGLDVGIASDAPPNTVSGWDLDRAYFHLDSNNDQLNVGFKFYGIAGDADGDGVEGGTAPWLAGNFGIDLPLLAQTESICIGLDFDQDGDYDLVAGTGMFDGVHRVSTFLPGTPLMPADAFGLPLPQHQGPHFFSPSALTPDYELTLDNISSLLLYDGPTTCFDYVFFAGSYQDNGVGEDYKYGTICFTDENVAAEEPAGFDLIRAYPNPFNPGTTLSVDLAATGPVELAVFNLGGQRVATLAKGLMPAGAHELRFEASHLPSGLYLARLSTASSVQVARLVLSK
ncbi:MAG: T9SS type A sorting domain-containing protein [bacterium]|jgi:hypothetical protein|nr:T9SS type A sorting domain-containing protein [bacterium]